MINWFDMPAEGLSNGGLFEVKELEVTENGTYETKGEMYNKVVVNVEGGGGETWNTVFEGNVTTVENEKTGTTSGSIELDKLLPETIKVIFNGTEYICNMNTNGSFGAVYYAGRTDFTEYPFSINDDTLYTETAGTYTLKIEEPQSGGSSDFSTAEVTIIWSNPDIEEVVWNNCPAILEDLVRGVMYAETSPATIIVPLYQNKCYWDQSTSGLTLSGNIEDVGDGMIITGDCTITIS